MRKLFIWILVFGLVLLMGNYSFAARGKIGSNISQVSEIVVSGAGDGDYKTIEEALGNADEGDTILVKEGEYRENLYIDISNIKLIGEGSDKVTVISSGGESALSVDTVENVEIKGFTFIYSPQNEDKGNACVWINDSSHILFHDNAVKGATYSGVELSNVEESEIYGNEIFENEQSGIFINSGARNLLVYDNRSHDNGYHGIEISEDGTRPIIFKNKIYNNKESGIYVHDNALPVIKDNEIMENIHSGISVSREGSALIIKNTIKNNKEDGIYVYKNGKADIVENSIQNNGLAGVSIVNGTGTVIDNTLSNNTQFGIDLYAKPEEDLEEINYNITVYGNTINRNGYSGIGCGGELLHPSISKNRIESNKEDGILIYEGSKVDVLDNLILGSALNGIEIRKGASAYITHNTFVKNDTGIYIHDNAYFTGIYNIVAYNKLGIKYKKQDIKDTLHIMNIYWKNDTLSEGLEIGDRNIEKDPNFEDPENGNYNTNIEWRY